MDFSDENFSTKVGDKSEVGPGLRRSARDLARAPGSSGAGGVG